MCTLYSITKGQQAIREITRAMLDKTGNLPTFPGVFPDYSAPIVRNTTEGREPILARWKLQKNDARGMLNLQEDGAGNLYWRGRRHKGRVAFQRPPALASSVWDSRTPWALSCGLAPFHKISFKVNPR